MVNHLLEHYHPIIIFISISTPLSPCGERRTSSKSHRRNRHFNPLSPCGERRGQRLKNGSDNFISIHSPHAGRDCKISQKFINIIKVLCYFVYKVEIIISWKYIVYNYLYFLGCENTYVYMFKTHSHYRISISS